MITLWLVLAYLAGFLSPFALSLLLLWAAARGDRA